jgi:hypothetical protein
MKRLLAKLDVEAFVLDVASMPAELPQVDLDAQQGEPARRTVRTAGRRQPRQGGLDSAGNFMRTIAPARGTDPVLLRRRHPPASTPSFL